MNIYKEIIKNEVFAATGCTEPISCAYAAAVAAKHLAEPVEKIVLKVDPGTFKNGSAVTIPHTKGLKGNLIAAILGAILAKPEAKFEILQSITPEIFNRAKKLYDLRNCEIKCIKDHLGFHVEASVFGKNHKSCCILHGTHTHIEKIKVDEDVIYSSKSQQQKAPSNSYKHELKKMKIDHIIDVAEHIDADDISYLKQGIDMSLSISKKGLGLKKSAYQLEHIRKNGFLSDDLFFKAKLKVAAGIDARMAGLEMPAMTSGGSGNQGIITFLTPYIVGKHTNVDETTIIKSIALAHMINSYTKCYIGELSVVCGCAMSAGISAAAAIVYQKKGNDIKNITLAIGNVIGDLSGLICDGAKSGCALKALTSVDTALRSGFMALSGYGLDIDEGMIGKTVEESIQNLGRITIEGMLQVDPTVLKILSEKNR